MDQQIEQKIVEREMCIRDRPLVVRLEGTNVAEGRRILQESGLRFHTASSMSEAAHLIVGLAAESPQEAGV